MPKTKTKKSVDRAPSERIMAPALSTPAMEMPELDRFAAPTVELLEPDFRVAPSERIEAAGAWQRDKRVAALWGANQTRNSWILIEGVGWRKLSMRSDSATLALTVLASSGKLTQTRVDYREEPDGMIHELYVW